MPGVFLFMGKDSPKMRAIHESGVVRTAFSIHAEDRETEAAIAARMGDEIDADSLEEGVLGHEAHTPMDEQMYCAAGWESRTADQEICPELPLQAA